MTASQRTIRRMTRRDFGRRAAACSFAAAFAPVALAPARASSRRPSDDLRITRILAQNAPGRRRTPVAPNAYAAYRGYGVNEPLVRIQTNQGIEGLGRLFNAEKRQEPLRALIGLNPFDLFEWRDGRVAAPAEEHGELLESLRSIDVAVFDLLGRATGRPAADLLGPRRRDSVEVYDSTLYMDDLLTDEQRVGLAYLRGGQTPRNDAELVARKAAWLAGEYYRDEGLRIFKIKTGRAKWMDSYEAALDRDVEVFRAVRDALGPHYTLFVDANNGYDADHTAAMRFIERTSDATLYGIEEAFADTKVDEHREMIEHAISLGLAVRNIDGETGGIPRKSLEASIDTPRGMRPLFAINNPSFSHAYGFHHVARIARECEAMGIDIGPHNFASKIGFYASVHAGLATPNWAYAETDDSEFPALRLEGIEIRNGRARLTGTPGLGISIDPDKLDPPRLMIE